MAIDPAVEQLSSFCKKLEQKKEKLQQKFLEDLDPDEIKENSIKLQEIDDAIETKTERWFELGAKAE